jgi:GTP cyclohydrolase II
MYGIEHAAETAQKGGVGIIAYYRKEGRALGEVTKFLVYNARKRQEGGDSAATYFKRTECVAGVEDARFQEFMPDVLHFFGIKKIHNLHSMSNMKYNAIVNSGIEVVNRVSIPDELIPKDAQVEMEAKKAAGYFTEGEIKKGDDLQKVKGRDIT